MADSESGIQVNPHAVHSADGVDTAWACKMDTPLPDGFERRSIGGEVYAIKRTRSAGKPTHTWAQIAASAATKKQALVGEIAQERRLAKFRRMALLKAARAEADAEAKDDSKTTEEKAQAALDRAAFDAEIAKGN